ncbi:MAG: phosphate ABC transporter substrate-binding protein PstS, partial [Anaerolineae bacterium]
PAPLYTQWFANYARVDSSVNFSYQATGSGDGIAQITAKSVDFAGSDAILTDEQFGKAPGIQMIPMVAGPVVPIYNLKATDGQPITAGLNLPYTALADIFLGKITRWNDPVLVKANPDLALPDKDIITVHRSDSSGTTFAFTDYLSHVSPAWKTQVGSATSVKWPVGMEGAGSNGLANTVAQNDGAIGYVEYAYAVQHGLPSASVQNKADLYVIPTTFSVQAAMEDFGLNPNDRGGVSLVDSASKGAWPISTYTYLLVYSDQQDCAKAQKLVAFVKWALGDGSQTANDLKYIPLSSAVRDSALTRLARMTCNGKPLQ